MGQDSALFEEVDVLFLEIYCTGLLAGRVHSILSRTKEEKESSG